MTSVDPIVQCAACGAKLKLRAATLKVIKQVRCVKCQKTLEIPAVLKGGGPVPEGPVLANPVETPAAAPAPSPVAAPPPVAAAEVAPAPVAAAAAEVAPAPVAAAAAEVAPAPVAATVPEVAPAPVAAASAAVPVIVPPMVSPAASVLPVSPVAPVPGDPLLVSRISNLERRLDAQQLMIETLSSQIRKLVQLQAAAANACLEGLPK